MYNLRDRSDRKRKLEGGKTAVKKDKIDVQLLDLPDLCLKKIFSFLSLDDLKAVRLVAARLSEAVLYNEIRFRNWKIDITKDLQQNTDKVFQHRINIEAVLDDNRRDRQNKIESWLIKHSAHITGLEIHTNWNIGKSPQYLKQVKQLYLDGSLFYSTVKTLLFWMGPQIESLTLCNFSEINYLLPQVDLSSLKQLVLEKCYQDILKIAPPALEDLSIEYERRVIEIRFPYSMNHLTNLKALSIKVDEQSTNYLELDKLPAQLMSATLTRLSLSYITLERMDFVDQDLPSITTIELIGVEAEMAVLNNLLMRCSNSLAKLKLKDVKIYQTNDQDDEIDDYANEDEEEAIDGDDNADDDNDVEDLGVPQLPALSEILLIDLVAPNDWLFHLISSCSHSLIDLSLMGVDMSALEDLTSNLPFLKHVIIRYSIKHITRISYDEYATTNSWPLKLIPACHETLTSLVLENIADLSILEHLACDLPKLKYLTLTGFTENQQTFDINSLLRKCSATLKFLSLWNLDVNFNVNLPKLKFLYLIEVKVKGFTKLVEHCGSDLELICLNNVEGSFWNEILDCKFPILKLLKLSSSENMDHQDILEKVVDADVIVSSNDKDYDKIITSITSDLFEFLKKYLMEEINDSE